MQLRENLLSLAKIYELLEAHLRKATADDKPLTTKELLNMPDIVQCRSNKKQVVNALVTLTKRGHLIIKKAEKGTTNFYKWNPMSGPFIIGLQKKTKAEKLPSKVSIAKQAISQPALPKERKTEKEVELVFGGTLIVIGRNVVTGRLRLVLEDAGTV